MSEGSLPASDSVVGAGEVGSINGIEVAARGELSARMADVSSVSRFSGPWTASTQWLGGFRVAATARGHTIDFDEPADLTGRDSAPTPHEYLLSAVAACITDGMVLHATLAGVQLSDLRVTVQARFDNILRWAGLVDQGNPGFHSLEIKGVVVAEADADVLDALWSRAVSGSPVAQTVARPTSLVTKLEVVDEV
ncbi:OsmC family protein [Gordonia sp. NB41Y]|uniref:OsmC family protein n=1 Tax=Gordonia sp. NB41Y TaxID=875808 RepID=UPI0006B157EA|nr:OsmC family protein [Gordonia sp. NB41Y]KOY48902.1 hypothetical protein ISGA_13685 [Gordonia sp. NB41Y]WLP92109.1 OsmC family protein [Gordonia sp. NB41Y]